MLPGLIAHIIWWSYAFTHTSTFSLFTDVTGDKETPNWYMCVTMTFGSMVAGATSEASYGTLRSRGLMGLNLDPIPGTWYVLLMTTFKFRRKLRFRRGNGGAVNTQHRVHALSSVLRVLLQHVCHAIAQTHHTTSCVRNSFGFVRTRKRNGSCLAHAVLAARPSVEMRNGSLI